MRFTLLTLALCASIIGCKPATETLPKVTPKPASSATTVDPVGESDPKAAPAGEAKDAPAAAAPATEPPATETPAAEAPAGGAPAAPADPDAPKTSSKSSGAAVRFVADKKLEVPTMMCPYGCYPSVEKALASVPGVKGVQLAEQPAGTKDGEIALRVIELKLAEGFDVSAAIAALQKAEFPATEVN